MPTPPKAPAVPSSSDLSSELEAYAKAEPETASAPASSADESADADKQDVQAYLRELQSDPKVEAHH